MHQQPTVACGVRLVCCEFIQPVSAGSTTIIGEDSVVYTEILQVLQVYLIYVARPRGARLVRRAYAVSRDHFVIVAADFAAVHWSIKSTPINQR